MNIHIANLPRDIDEAKLRALFTPYGKVESVHIEMDKISGKPDGFAFVEMADDEQGKAAIEALRGKKLTDYALALKEVEPPDSGKTGPGGKGARGHKEGEGGAKGTGKGGGYRAGGGSHGTPVRRGGQRGI